MKIRHTGGGVVVGKDGRVVVVSQHGNSWSLPKGGVDPGEDLQQATVREIKEETGISKVSLICRLGTYQRQRIPLDEGPVDNQEIKEITLFLYTTEQEHLQPEDPDNPEAIWVGMDKVADILTHPKDKEFYSSLIPAIKEHLAAL